MIYTGGPTKDETSETTLRNSGLFLIFRISDNFEFVSVFANH